MKTPTNFASLGSSLLKKKPEAAKTTQTEEPEKGQLLSFHVDKDLKKPLDRVVFWRKFEGGLNPKNAKQREVINEALRLLFASDPNAQRLMPGENPSGE